MPANPDRIELEAALPGLVIDEQADNDEYQLEALQMREPLVHEDPPVGRLIFE